jgi:hypothetical protein
MYHISVQRTPPKMGNREYFDNAEATRPYEKFRIAPTILLISPSWSPAILGCPFIMRDFDSGSIPGASCHSYFSANFHTFQSNWQVRLEGCAQNRVFNIDWTTRFNAIFSRIYFERFDFAALFVVLGIRFGR